ncbi:MAG TPA: hypothetical protein VJY99_06470 [Buttiauxella sp.]|uniref:hypothetical protein n=1 Tax=Buttiauxella sp. TaxID=1972222 RepID=UPI002B47B503|nr:hypothetical protein [Buttiauxella sp.]HKM96333.1 hypothetical protein [Buttiauxella sp.]
MANADSNTSARPEIEPAITTLLKTPLGATHDLFQVLEQCQRYVDGLIENDNHVECMALCGRLLAGLDVLKFTLKSPLPEHLIESLTTDITKPDDYRCPLSTDSETLREYCAALTMLLLNQLESPDQVEKITGILFEMVTLLAEDLRAPRFMRAESGLVMIGGEAVPGTH